MFTPLPNRKRRSSRCLIGVLTVTVYQRFDLIDFPFTSIISRQPILEQLETVWKNVNQRGWINIQATQSLESLLNTGGSLWFVSNIVKEVLKYRYQEELDQAVDLAFAIFHLDIENCTLDLINHIIPQYLYNSLQ